MRSADIGGWLAIYGMIAVSAGCGSESSEGDDVTGAAVQAVAGQTSGAGGRRANAGAAAPAPQRNAPGLGQMCGASAPDCPIDSECVELKIWSFGMCIPRCKTDADCGYDGPIRGACEYGISGSGLSTGFGFEKNGCALLCGPGETCPENLDCAGEYCWPPWPDG